MVESEEFPSKRRLVPNQEPLGLQMPLHSPIAHKIEKVYKKIDRFNKNQRQVLKASGEIDMAKVREFSDLIT